MGSEQKYGGLDIVRLQGSAKVEDRVRDIRRDAKDEMVRCFNARASVVAYGLSAAIKHYKSQLGDDRSALAQAMKENAADQKQQRAPAWKVGWYQFREGIRCAGSKDFWRVQYGSLGVDGLSFTAAMILMALLFAPVAGGVQMLAAIPLFMGMVRVTSRFLTGQDAREGKRNKMLGLPQDTVKTNAVRKCYNGDGSALTTLGSIVGWILPAVASLTLVGSLWGELRLPQEKTQPAKTEPAAAARAATRDPSTLKTPTGDLKLAFDQKVATAKPAAQPGPIAAPSAPKPQQ